MFIFWYLSLLLSSIVFLFYCKIKYNDISFEYIKYLIFILITSASVYGLILNFSLTNLLEERNIIISLYAEDNIPKNIKDTMIHEAYSRIVDYKNLLSKNNILVLIPTSIISSFLLFTAIFESHCYKIIKSFINNRILKRYNKS